MEAFLSISVYLCVSFPVYLLAHLGGAGTAACKPLQLLVSKCSPSVSAEDLLGMGRTSWEWGLRRETGQTQTPVLVELAPGPRDKHSRKELASVLLRLGV